VNKNPLVLSFFFREPFPKRTTLLLVPLSLKIPFLRQQLKISTIDPALQLPLASALCFVMAVQFGDFTDEVTVGKQEQLQDQIDHFTKSPSMSAAFKTYKVVLKHPKQEGWLKAIQEELQNLFCHQIWTIELVTKGKQVMGARWVFLEKKTAGGKLI
jgi:hypothetical protein